MKRASTRQHTAHSTAEQSKVVYCNNSGGQPHHPPRAPTPARGPLEKKFAPIFFSYPPPPPGVAPEKKSERTCWVFFFRKHDPCWVSDLNLHVNITMLHCTRFALELHFS